VSRHAAAGRLKVETPTAAAAAVAATAGTVDTDRPATSVMHRIASSPAITDRHGRHQSRASPAFLTTDEVWKLGGRGAQHVRLSKTPADETLMLAPPSRAMWQGGSIAGRRPSTESNKQTRYLAVSVIHCIIFVLILSFVFVSLVRLHHYHGEDYCFCHYFYYYTFALFFLRFPPNFTRRDPRWSLLHSPIFIDLDLLFKVTDPF